MTQPVDDIYVGLMIEKQRKDMVEEMSKRKNLDLGVGRLIYMMARNSAAEVGQQVDMVLVACAIKYAGDNKHLLKFKGAR
ncbi:hypothetical protein SEA_ZEINA_84 [Arthrobacter phage Zeina]|nr:hypothetical protein SEA_ZEINA_84 [Arthrobacter phage Zeina]